MKDGLVDEILLITMAIVVIVGIAAMVVLVVHDKSPCQPDVTIEAPQKHNGGN